MTEHPLLHGLSDALRRHWPSEEPHLLIGGELLLEGLAEPFTLFSPGHGLESGRVSYFRGIRMPPREFESLLPA